jgi:hypothetical protein
VPEAQVLSSPPVLQATSPLPMLPNCTLLEPVPADPPPVAPAVAPFPALDPPALDPPPSSLLLLQPAEKAAKRAMALMTGFHMRDAYHELFG